MLYPVKVTGNTSQGNQNNNIFVNFEGKYSWLKKIKAFKDRIDTADIEYLNEKLYLFNWKKKS